MAVVMPDDIGAIIINSPEIRGGRPRIAGTGVTVERIVTWHQLGYSPEEIVREIPHLTLTHVYAALAYYYAHKAEIDASMAQEESEATKLEAEWRASKLRDAG